MATEAQQQEPTIETIPLVDIKTPERTEKLHPIEDEDPEDWENFLKSVGTTPDQEIDVRVRNGNYELIDGDRRVRAVEENGGEEIRSKVFSEMSDEEFYARRIRSNELRKENNPFRRSWYAAQYVAPWLLPPGERFGVEKMTQYEYADLIGYSQGSVSQWLGPMRNENPIRSVVGDEAVEHATDNIPSDEAIQQVDEIVSWLLGQGEHKRVVSRNLVGKVADEVGDMSGISLAEIHTVAEMAAENGWDEGAFLEQLNKYASDPSDSAPVKIESGLRNSDPSKTETHDGDPDRVGEAEGKEGPNWSQYNEDFNKDQSPELPEVSVPEVDWTEYVSDEDLQGDETVTSIAESQRFVPEVPLQGEAAVALNLLAEMYDVERSDAIRFFWPAIVEEAIDHFAE